MSEPIYDGPIGDLLDSEAHRDGIVAALTLALKEAERSADPVQAIRRLLDAALVGDWKSYYGR